MKLNPAARLSPKKYTFADKPDQQQQKYRENAVPRVIRLAGSLIPRRAVPTPHFDLVRPLIQFALLIATDSVRPSVPQFPNRYPRITGIGEILDLSFLVDVPMIEPIQRRHGNEQQASRYRVHRKPVPTTHAIVTRGAPIWFWERRHFCHVAR